MMELYPNAWTGSTLRRIAMRAIRLYVQQEFMSDIPDKDIDVMLDGLSRYSTSTPRMKTPERSSAMQESAKEMIILSAEFAMRWSGGAANVWGDRLSYKITMGEAVDQLLGDAPVKYSNTQRAFKAA